MSPPRSPCDSWERLHQRPRDPECCGMQIQKTDERRNRSFRIDRLDVHPLASVQFQSGGCRSLELKQTETKLNNFWSGSSIRIPSISPTPSSKRRSQLDSAAIGDEGWLKPSRCSGVLKRGRRRFKGGEESQKNSPRDNCGPPASSAEQPREKKKRCCGPADTGDKPKQTFCSSSRSPDVSESVSEMDGSCVGSNTSLFFPLHIQI